MFAPFLALRKGWSVYFSYDVKFAGLGLACVYMTVLGFDNISNGKLPVRFPLYWYSIIEHFMDKVGFYFGIT